jgi:hypothetical protein
MIHLVGEILVIQRSLSDIIQQIIFFNAPGPHGRVIAPVAANSLALPTLFS